MNCVVYKLSQDFILRLLSANEKHKMRKRFGSNRKVGGGTVTDRMGSPHWGDIFKTWKESGPGYHLQEEYFRQREEQVQDLEASHVSGVFGDQPVCWWPGLSSHSGGCLAWGILALEPTGGWAGLGLWDVGREWWPLGGLTQMSTCQSCCCPCLCPSNETSQPCLCRSPSNTNR